MAYLTARRGCGSSAVLHSQEDHPLLVITFRGDLHLTAAVLLSNRLSCCEARFVKWLVEGSEREGEVKHIVSHFMLFDEVHSSEGRKTSAIAEVSANN